MGERIPIAAAKRIAVDYGYDQVIVLARRTGDKGLSWATTYGVNKDHCDAAGKIGAYFLRLEGGKEGK